MIIVDKSIFYHLYEMLHFCKKLAIWFYYRNGHIMKDIFDYYDSGNGGKITRTHFWVTMIWFKINVLMRLRMLNYEKCVLVRLIENILFLPVRKVDLLMFDWEHSFFTSKKIGYQDRFSLLRALDLIRNFNYWLNHQKRRRLGVKSYESDSKSRPRKWMLMLEFS